VIGTPTKRRGPGLWPQRSKKPKARNCLELVSSSPYKKERKKKKNNCRAERKTVLLKRRKEVGEKRDPQKGRLARRPQFPLPRQD